ncbi:TPA: hypothetical protein MBI04_003577 [Klebsiella pneumoniae]|nr:hypothetical protein [Klebsiella pneumoniae]
MKRLIIAGALALASFGANATTQSYTEMFKCDGGYTATYKFSYVFNQGGKGRTSNHVAILKNGVLVQSASNHDQDYNVSSYAGNGTLNEDLVVNDEIRESGLGTASHPITGNDVDAYHIASDGKESSIILAHLNQKYDQVFKCTESSTPMETEN